MATIIQDAIWPFRAGRPMTRDNGLIQMGIMGRKFSLINVGSQEKEYMETGGGTRFKGYGSTPSTGSIFLVSITILQSALR